MFIFSLFCDATYFAATFLLLIFSLVFLEEGGGGEGESGIKISKGTVLNFNKVLPSKVQLWDLNQSKKRGGGLPFLDDQNRAKSLDPDGLRVQFSIIYNFSPTKKKLIK